MIENWGTAPDGTPVQRVTLERDGLRATVISFGGVLQSLFLDGHAPSLVLGFDQVERYFRHSNCFGATVGRYANRISNGRFDLDGRTHQLNKNQDGKHTLHGGADNTTYRNWTITDHGEDFVEMSDVLPNGHMGFPGKLSATARYWIKDNQRLGFRVTAQTDAPTVCNFTCHNYFNLDGAATIKHHKLLVSAENYLPVDAEGIPTAGPTPFTDSAFDFRKPRSLEDGGEITAIDHNFCFSNQKTARLISTQSNITMEITTNQPGLQVYTGAKINSRSNPTPFAGIALEPQNWPDAPNNPSFPNSVLRAGQTYHHETQLKFSSA